jgi:voltage-gated potassium channel Kch
MLLAAKVGSAKLFVLAIDNVDESIKTAELVRRHFPNVPIFARARNRFHVYKLLDLGIEVISRETLLSSLEMARKAIEFLGTPPNEAKKMVEKFINYDEEFLKKQYSVYQNEAELIETSKQARADLEALFENDNREIDRLAKIAPEGR